MKQSGIDNFIYCYRHKTASQELSKGFYEEAKVKTSPAKIEIDMIKKPIETVFSVLFISFEVCILFSINIMIIDDIELYEVLKESLGEKQAKSLVG